MHILVLSVWQAEHIHFISFVFFLSVEFLLFCALSCKNKKALALLDFYPVPVCLCWLRWKHAWRRSLFSSTILIKVCFMQLPLALDSLHLAELQKWKSLPILLYLSSQCQPAWHQKPMNGIMTTPANLPYRLDKYILLNLLCFVFFFHRRTT